MLKIQIWSTLDSKITAKILNVLHDTKISTISTTGKSVTPHIVTMIWSIVSITTSPIRSVLRTTLIEQNNK